VVKIRAALILTLGYALLNCAVAIGMLTSRNAAGQANAVESSEAARGPVRGAEDAPPQGLAFEVASIKPNKSGGSRSGTSLSGGRFTATNTDIKTLMQYNAFGIPGMQILGGSSWLSTERFNIDAKMDDTVAEQMKKLSGEAETLWMRQMVQQMLADRFKLAFHRETDEFSVYALVVAKNGPKIERAKNADGSPSVSWGNGKLKAESVTMEKLAQTLTMASSRELGRIVIDKTGLDGKYDLTLAWSPDDRSAAMASTQNENAAPPGPSIFTAVQEQLGLKLESRKAPVGTVVIDHIEQPSEN
jgi:uncharacterized protein (TIGR03435 family)